MDAVNAGPYAAVILGNVKKPRNSLKPNIVKMAWPSGRALYLFNIPTLGRLGFCFNGAWLIKREAVKNKTRLEILGKRKGRLCGPALGELV